MNASRATALQPLLEFAFETLPVLRPGIPSSSQIHDGPNPVRFFYTQDADLESLSVFCLSMMTSRVSNQSITLLHDFSAYPSLCSSFAHGCDLTDYFK